MDHRIYFLFSITQLWESHPLPPLLVCSLLFSLSFLCTLYYPNGGRCRGCRGLWGHTTPCPANRVWVSGARDPCVCPPMPNQPRQVPRLSGLGIFLCFIQICVSKPKCLHAEERQRQSATVTWVCKALGSSCALRWGKWPQCPITILLPTLRPFWAMEACHVEDSDTEPGCPKVWMSYCWKCSTLGWTRLWATSPGEGHLCPWQSVGPVIFKCLSQPKPFCDCMMAPSCSPLGCPWRPASILAFTLTCWFLSPPLPLHSPSFTSVTRCGPKAQMTARNKISTPLCSTNMVPKRVIGFIPASSSMQHPAAFIVFMAVHPHNPPGVFWGNAAVWRSIAMLLFGCPDFTSNHKKVSPSLDPAHSHQS